MWFTLCREKRSRFALVLIKISASICVTSEGLQGRVMEVYLQWSSQFKKKKKIRERNSDRGGFEIDVCVEKFLFLLLPRL